MQEKQIVAYCLKKKYLNLSQAKVLIKQYYAGQHSNLLLFLAKQMNWDAERIAEIRQTLGILPSPDVTFKAELKRLVQQGKIRPQQVPMLCQLYKRGNITQQWLRQKYGTPDDDTALTEQIMPSKSRKLAKAARKRRGAPRALSTKPGAGAKKKGAGPKARQATSPSAAANGMTEDDQKTGTLIYRYRSIRKIGAGGMGEVYEAEDEKTGQRVAIKIVKPADEDESYVIKRFAREIKLHQCLNHPNIVRVLNWGFHEDLLYLVMELVNGMDLHAVLGKFGSFKPKRALQLAIPIASALEHALEHNIVHRDLKPANILIDSKTGHVKLTDMGLAKIAQEGGLTLSGEIMGTPYYMSPEQVHKSSMVDHRADIYSLGATLYHMLSGKLPYAEYRNTYRILEAKVTQDPIPLEELVTDLPSSLVALVQKAMARDVRQRFQTPTAMKNAMQEILAQLS